MNVTPTLFGRYQILERIAIGGMAEIFRAQAPPLAGHRGCVIKRILPQYTRDATFVSMFVDEARITIGLEHKNIVSLFDFGQVDGSYFMAMEYVDGTDLSALMRVHLLEGKALEPALAAFVAREVLLGLAHAHALRDHNGRPLGIVHRDISPQNVLLSLQGEVKVTDFGIAAARHKLTLTSPGMVLGKAAYMSPEQATGRFVDTRTDVWAVGVILHEMLSGDRLFADDTPLLAVQRVVHDDILPPSAKAAAVPVALDAITMRALSRELSARYSCAQEMASELTDFLRTTPFGERDLRDAIAGVQWRGADTAPLRPTQVFASRAHLDVAYAAPKLLCSPPKVGELHHASDDELSRLAAQLAHDGDVWSLVLMGDRYRQLGHADVAVSAYRVAAAAFAYRGLLVQALCAYEGAKATLTPTDVERDLMVLADLTAGVLSELLHAVTLFDAHEIWSMLRDGNPDSFVDGAVPLSAPTPLLASLGPREFRRLGMVARVRQFAPGAVVLHEGALGDALYAVGRGRLVVYCRPGDTEAQSSGADDPRRTQSVAPIQLPPTPHRVYLAGLADGDFFGEFSFLTERPRSATVEAIGSCVVLEIDSDGVRALLQSEPSFTEPLLQFYKERVVEIMMAKSPVFASLEPNDRRQLLRDSTVAEFADGACVVEEGTTNDALYFIKRGEAEVFRTDADQLSIFINKLQAGEFFGEVAALRGTARSVSVRAMGELTVLRIERDTLLNIVGRQPRLKAMFDATMRVRAAELQSRVREHERVFFGT